ncbi:GGDEF domain-containing protein [Edaphobacter modestus]|uniref:diguanylate cyclase n=1 Tax=Edaphobacter modestus TaxID=388466 RepID=A0A4Q7YZC5_9BACT|nr:GGDEF domain-containing protein [Edaphobacter modestus]RZU43148.1 diguanylate cyclase (GGDEF)-like protein [Edaphobacter modestus]
MDTATLVLANVLLFALCAAVMLVNARMVGGMRGAVWFAGANLCRGTSMLVAGMSWLHLESARFGEAISGILAMAGVLLLHQSFAELLERKAILRVVQFGLTGIVTLALIYFMVFPTQSQLPGAMLCATLGVLHALVAVLVFRFSDEEVGPVGWLTSLALAGYALILFVRAVARADLSWSGYVAEWARAAPGWLMACLITSAATAFGFMSLSTAKLRVELLWRAQVDELTGLLNRWALKRTALREIQNCRRSNSSMAVVMMDLDGLKIVNDSKGHSCGDVVLQAVAGVLQETVRAGDSVARMGGDEFCVLLPKSSLEEAMMVAERLKEEISDLVIRFRGDVVQTSASLGVASSDISGLQWQSLIDDSDAALYHAKRKGKNKVIAAAPAWMPEMIQERFAGEQDKGYSDSI